MLTIDHEIEESDLETQIWEFLPPKLEILWDNNRIQNKEGCISQQRLYSAFERQGSHVS